MSLAERGKFEARRCENFVHDGVAAVSCDTVAQYVDQTLPIGLVARMIVTAESLA